MPERKLHTLAVVLSSLVIPLPLLVGRIVEAILDSSNPANVDVTQPLAYLTEILGWGFGSLGVLLVAIVAVNIMLFRRDKSLVRLPLLVLAIQLAVGVVSLLLGGAINGGS